MFSSLNPNQFWKRWHISLTSWLRDYIHFPLALRFIRREIHFSYKNGSILITWFLSGLWHGANYTFIVWGMYWSIILIIYKYLKPKNYEDNKIINLIKILWMNLIVMISYVFFRNETLTDSFNYFISMLSKISIPSSQRRVSYM